MNLHHIAQQTNLHHMQHHYRILSKEMNQYQLHSKDMHQYQLHNYQVRGSLPTFPVSMISTIMNMQYWHQYIPQCPCAILSSLLLSSSPVAEPTMAIYSQKILNHNRNHLGCHHHSNLQSQQPQLVSYLTEDVWPCMYHFLLLLRNILFGSSEFPTNILKTWIMYRTADHCNHQFLIIITCTPM